MFYKFIFFKVIIFSVLVTSLLIFIQCSDSDQKKIQKTSIYTYIKLTRPVKNVLLVSLASDAITAVKTNNGIILIDAGISHSLTKKYRSVIEKEFGTDKFLYLINTHSHSDHTGGNLAFSGTEILGHVNCLDEMPGNMKNADRIREKLTGIVQSYKKELNEYQKGSKEWEESYCQMLRYEFALRDFRKENEACLPTLLFRDSLNLLPGDITLDMAYFGKAHSGSDIFIHIPELKVLFAGDLIGKGGRASIGKIDKNSPERWPEFSTWIKKKWNNIDVVIGGHGEIMSKPELQYFLEQLEEKIL